MSALRCRSATAADLELLVEAENAAWDSDLRASRETIAARLAVNPEGYLIAFAPTDPRVLGFLFSICVSECPSHSARSWQTYADLALGFCPPSAHRYVISISVGARSPRGTATALLAQAAAVYARQGVRTLSLGARIPNYAREGAARGVSLDDYIRRVEAGEVREAAVGASLASGGKIVRGLPHYYADPESCDAAVLIAYDLAESGHHLTG